MKAVILAAGLGSRLGADHPKGLLAPGPETLVQRSVRLLEAHGLAPVHLVIGHLGARYRALPEPLQFHENPDYATTGSLRSLLLAHAALQDDLLVLESDLLYEARAIPRILAAGPNAILTSGFTGAGDEVYVEAENGRLRGLSKTRPDQPVGEFVGISRFSRALLDGLAEWGAGRPEAHYESDGLVALCREHEVEVELVPDLVWCEVDDAAHWERCQSVVAPRLREVE